MDHYWSAMFPPLQDPIRLIPWLVRSFTGQLCAYPVGGAKGASILTVVCVAAGLLDLWRRGRSTIVVVCLAPLGLALIASALRFYPFGESERLMQFEGPMICLLAGHGLACLLGRFRHPNWYRRTAGACLVLFALIGVGVIVTDLLHPGQDDLRPPGPRVRPPVLARRRPGRRGRLLSSRPRPRIRGRPDSSRPLGPIPLLPEDLFEPASSGDHPLDWSRVSTTRPLRCVLYDGVPVDSTLFASWMDRMSRHYRLAWTETYRANAGVAMKGVTYEDHLAVLEFVPRGDPVDPVKLARIASSTDFEPRSGSMELSGFRWSLLR